MNCGPYLILDLIVRSAIKLVDDPTRVLLHRFRKLLLELTLVQRELALKRLHIALNGGLPVLKQLVFEGL